jgi:hypothetical protein
MAAMGEAKLYISECSLILQAVFSGFFEGKRSGSRPTHAGTQRSSAIH